MHYQTFSCFSLANTLYWAFYILTFLKIRLCGEVGADMLDYTTANVGSFWYNSEALRLGQFSGCRDQAKLIDPLLFINLCHTFFIWQMATLATYFGLGKQKHRYVVCFLWCSFVYPYVWPTKFSFAFICYRSVYLICCILHDMHRGCFFYLTILSGRKLERMNI